MRLRKVPVKNIIGDHLLLKNYTNNDHCVTYPTMLLAKVESLCLETLSAMVAVDVVECEANKYELICPCPLYYFLCRIRQFEKCSINVRIHTFEEDQENTNFSLESKINTGEEPFMVIALLVKFAIEEPYYKNSGSQLFNRIEAIKNGEKSSPALNNILNTLLAKLMKRTPSAIRGVDR